MSSPTELVHHALTEFAEQIDGGVRPTMLHAALLADLLLAGGCTLAGVRRIPTPSTEGGERS